MLLVPDNNICSRVSVQCLIQAVFMRLQGADANMGSAETVAGAAMVDGIVYSVKHAPDSDDGEPADSDWGVRNLEQDFVADVPGLFGGAMFGEPAFGAAQFVVPADDVDVGLHGAVFVKQPVADELPALFGGPVFGAPWYNKPVGDENIGVFVGIANGAAYVNELAADEPAWAAHNMEPLYGENEGFGGVEYAWDDQALELGEGMYVDPPAYRLLYDEEPNAGYDVELVDASAEQVGYD
jgi:hypothetical protein